MAIDIKELTKNKPMKMSQNEVERLVKSYMKNSFSEANLSVINVGMDNGIRVSRFSHRATR